MYFKNSLVYFVGFFSIKSIPLNPHGARLKYTIVIKVKYESDVDRRRISGSIRSNIFVIANGQEVNLKSWGKCKLKKLGQM